MDKLSYRSLNSVLGRITRDNRGAKQRRLILFQSRAVRIHSELELLRAIRASNAALGECRRVKPALVPQPRAGRHRRLVSGRFDQVPAIKQQFVLCLRIRCRRNSSCLQSSVENTLQCQRPAALLVFARGRHANKTSICNAEPQPLIAKSPKLAGSMCARAEQKEKQREATSGSGEVVGAFGGGHRSGRHA